jgi:hypothetical protein
MPRDGGELRYLVAAHRDCGFPRAEGAAVGAAGPVPPDSGWRVGGPADTAGAKLPQEMQKKTSVATNSDPPRQRIPAWG